MAVIGYTGGGTFLEHHNQDGRVNSSKFTAPSSFTPLRFWYWFTEAWGASGTLYMAIYDDNAGTPGTKIWEGSQAYSAGQGGWNEFVMSSPPSLTSGNDYWLATHCKKDSGSFIVYGYSDHTTGTIKRWQETAGSWTDDPTITGTDNNERLRIYATNEGVPSHTTDTLLKKAATKTHTSDVLTQQVNTKSHTTDAFLQAVVGKPVWVSPANHATDVLSDEPLVFTMPTFLYPMHFHIQVDTVATFDSGALQEFKSWEDQTNWEYHNGSSWVAVPQTGVPIAYSGNNARYTPSPLTEGLKYRRVRGRVMKY